MFRTAVTTVAAANAVTRMTFVGSSAPEWLDAFAQRLGVETPSPDERVAILALAGVAAHASDRTAAPVACWLAAKAGVSADAAREIAAQVGAPGDSDPSD